MEFLNNLVTVSSILAKKGKEKMTKVKVGRKIKFTKDNSIVMAWVSMVLAGAYTFEQVPKLHNLREVVAEVLADTAETKEEEEVIK